MGAIAVFMFEGMTDYEIIFPMHLLHADAGFEIIPCAYTLSDIHARSGMTYRPQCEAGSLCENDLSGLILPGGWYGELSPELKSLLKSMKQKQKLIVC